MHGAVLTSSQYISLANLMSEKFRLYIPDRRGRGLSGRYAVNHGMREEIEDLNAILKRTGACLVFGHSVGALITLEASLTLQIKKMALYEPPILRDGKLPFPTKWIGDFEKAIKEGAKVRAMVLFQQGMEMSVFLSKMPYVILKLLFSVFLRGKDARETYEVLPTLIDDINTCKALDPNLDRYKQIQTDTLLLYGEGSPTYLKELIPILFEKIPNCEAVGFEDYDHGTPVSGKHQKLAESLTDFFSF